MTRERACYIAALALLTHLLTGALGYFAARAHSLQQQILQSRVDAHLAQVERSAVLHAAGLVDQAKLAQVQACVERGEPDCG